MYFETEIILDETPYSSQIVYLSESKAMPAARNQFLSLFFAIYRVFKNIVALLSTQ